MTSRLELWVEGSTDAQARWSPEEEERQPIAAGGALVPLVRRVLGPRGFGHFRNAIEDLIGPHLRSTST
ncbi:MAG TPA: hypothetical protein VLS89_16085 [Candidatus Nanopelagicales bacterium]|nr:hypothetical protein [Candidatus Nanopelagicales bacterium]